MMGKNEEAWPPLPIAEWQDTRDTLHMYTQIVGKIRLLLSPKVNHWWEVPLYVTARGLTTSPIPYDAGIFEIQFDFIEHRLIVQTSAGAVKTIPLAPNPVAEFYRAVDIRAAEPGNFGEDVDAARVRCLIPSISNRIACIPRTIQNMRIDSGACWFRPTRSSRSFAHDSWARAAQCTFSGGVLTWR